MAGLSAEERARWVDPAAEYRLLNRSIDLLHHVVPESRSCKDAGIVPECMVPMPIESSVNV
jgi:hypothetical protein